MRKGIRVSLLLGICLAFSLAAYGSQDVEAKPQAKAYRAQMKTIAAGDFEAYKNTMTSATQKQMAEQTKGKTPKEIMDFMKMLSPTDQKLTSVKVDGKKATLMVTGTMDGQAMAGSIDMEEEGGQWKVGKGSWEPAK